MATTKIKKIAVSAAILSVIFAVCMGFGVSRLKDACTVYASSSRQDISAQISALQQQLQAAQNDRSRAQQALNRIKNDKSSQLALKAEYDKEIEALQSLILSVSGLVEQYDLDIAASESKIAQLEQELNQENLAFDEMVRMSFMYGSDDYLEMIFDATDFSDFLSRLDMISYLLSYNQGIIDQIAVTEDNLKTTKENLVLSQTNLKNYKTSKEDLEKEYEEKSANAQTLIASLLNDEAAAASLLKEYENSEKQLQADIDELARQLQNDNTTYSGGEFIWPLDYSSRTSSGWEWRINPITGKKEFHNGLDLPAPNGTKIFAAADGTVVKSAWYGGYGNCVIINHGGGIMTLYGHCSKLNVTEGESVKQGSVIAYVGTSGMSTGYHLHFTVYENGNTAVNPWNYLQ